jgi:hypothetical protein
MRIRQWAGVDHWGARPGFRAMGCAAAARCRPGAPAAHQTASPHGHIRSQKPRTSRERQATSQTAGIRFLSFPLFRFLDTSRPSPMHAILIGTGVRSKCPTSHSNFDQFETLFLSELNSKMHRYWLHFISTAHAHSQSMHCNQWHAVFFPDNLDLWII